MMTHSDTTRGEGEIPFALSLRKWFLEKARDLPWRSQKGVSPSPYAVWISEIMLQQTQVAVVIPYFTRWMQQFGTIEELAKAPLDSVIKAWEGLGYYSRARNLHAAAKYIVEHHQGQLPEMAEELLRLPGLGPYTVGAIRSFAFHQKAAAIDGNVVRVMSRYLGIEDSFSTPRSMRLLEARVLALLPDNEPWVVMEALIELGATVCRKKAECFTCPLRAQCHAYLWDQTDSLPLPKKRPITEYLVRDVALVMCEGRVLVGRCKKNAIMSDLHEFPSQLQVKEGDVKEKEEEENEAIEGAELASKWPFDLKELMGLDKLKEEPHTISSVTHSYTHYRVTLHPRLFASKTQTHVEGFFWQPLHLLESLAFSAGHRKLANALANKSPKGQGT